MEINNTNYPANAFRLCIDGVKDGLSGTIYTPLTKESINFVGAESFLILDTLFDEVGYPQSFQDKRSFEKKPEKTNEYRGIPEGVVAPEDILDKMGKKATFDIVVTSRCNTTWQGVVFLPGMDGGTPFNGDLELMETIDNLI